LASRLSFFLWSSIPDDELLRVASAGRLSRPEQLERQARRMLADRRSSSFSSNFAGQWLLLRNLQMVRPNPDLFPDFNDNLRDAMRRESELFVDSIIREDRSALEFLSANYTFVNEPLAKFYGIPNIHGPNFQRVVLDASSPRVGLLGKASVLTTTSYGNRTSPVKRGNFILDNLLATPAPPPPPNVPALPENNGTSAPTSVRARMEVHRANPACAVCHSRIDPLGFALENFDAIGGWRTEDGSSPIDASGRLLDGTALTGPQGLRDALLKRDTEFVGALTEKVLIYALGRGLEYYDGPAIRRIVREAKSDNYRWSSLILAMVRSVPFQMRSSAS
jgi:hypothetical protein